MTNHEKSVYNTFLRVSRTQQNKPFKYRKNFEGFDPEKASYVTKIARLLSQYSHINIDDFFEAPYKAYSDEVAPYYDLKFFASRKSISAYTKYMRKVDNLDPDDPEMLRRIQSSLVFIKEFCKHKNICASEYFNHVDGLYPSFLVHLQQRKIWIYSVIGEDGFDNTLQSVESSMLLMLFSYRVEDRIPSMRTKYLNSKICKQFARKGFNQLIKLTSNV